MTTGFIYLASASPRRAELLRQIGVPFRIHAADVPETQRPGEDPAVYVERIAIAKAEAVRDAVRDQSPAPVLAADTTVVIDGEVFGKPADDAAALAMLERLSGRSHAVLTGVALCWDQGRESFVAESEVRFRATTAAERVAYCRTGEPRDKAGAYAIQGLAALFVEHLRGSYSAVMGLPLAETAALLGRFGLPAWLQAGDALV